MKHFLLLLLSCIAISAILHAQKWQSRGIGGGGALFVPSINPDNDKEFYVACDVSAMYHTYSFGHYYETVPFTQFQATTRCTASQNILRKILGLRHLRPYMMYIKRRISPMQGFFRTLRMGVCFFQMTKV